MPHQNYPDSKNIIEVFSEDIAELGSCVWSDLGTRNPERARRLKEILDKIYTGLFMNGTPVILLDKDGRNMLEFKDIV